MEMINRNVWIVTGCSIVFLTPSAAATEARERAELLIDAATRIERAAESENE